MNITITLENEFNDYSYLLNLMGKLSAGYEYHVYGDKDTKITGIKLMKKVYDKKKQVEKEKRIEIKFDKGYMIIKNIKSIEKDLIKPMEKHIIEGNELLKKVAKEEMTKDMKEWKRMFLYRAVSLKNAKGIPVVVDIEQILDIIRYFSPKNFNRNVEKLSKDIEDLAYLNNNFTKLTELKNIKKEKIMHGY